MAQQYGFEVVNLAEVQKAMEICAKKTAGACSDALQKGGMTIIADAQANLKANRTMLTGALRKSGRVEKLPDGDMEAGFYAEARTGDGEDAKGYAMYVENGRRSGKMPWPKLLEPWVKQKFGLARKKEISGAAFALARHIAMKGTKAHPFFGPAVKANEKPIRDAVAAAAKRIIDKNGQK